MPWGRYRGYDLNEIPSSYLCWCLESADALRLDLRCAIQAELQSRFAPSSLPPPSGRLRKPCPNPCVATDLIGAGLRALAKKAHPDVGGDTRQMQKINTVADWLKEIV